MEPLEYYNKNIGIATRLSNRIKLKHLKEDFKQEALLHLWESCVNYEQEESSNYPFPVYAYYHIKTALSNFMRAEKGYAEAIKGDIDTSIERTLKSSADVKHLVNSLDNICKSVVFLRVYGETNLETSKILGLSVRKTRKIYSDFRKELNNLL